MSDIYFSRINLADSGFIQRASILENETGTSLFSNVSQLGEEETIEKQLLILRSVSSEVASAYSANQRDVIQYYIDLICYIFLSVESKSPLKQYTSRLLMKFPKECAEDIAACLSNGLIDLIKPSNSANLNQIINKICDCFENFPIGVDAISLCLNEVLSFLGDCYHHVLDNLSEGLSPVQQMEFILKGHSALRAGVMILQKFFNRIKEVVKNESSKEANALKDMLCTSTELINHELVPMDSKGNCGMIIVILLESMHEDAHIVVLNKLTSEEFETPCRASQIKEISFKSKVAQMSVCIGLITVVPIEVLCSFNDDSKRFVIEAVLAKIMDLSESSTESNICLGCSRAVQQAVHILHNALMKNNSSSCITMLQNTQILVMTLDFVWSRLDHYMDCVRHAAKSILHDLVQMGNVLKKKEMDKYNFLDLIVNAVDKIPSYKKSKYIALSVLASELGCQKLKNVFPDLVHTLLVVIEDPSMSAHVSNAYESLMLKNFKEENETDWINTWISPVFETYSKSKVCYVLEGIIAKAMKICPALLDYTISSFEDDMIVSSRLKGFIACLKIGVKLGIFDRKCKENALCKDTNKWQGIINYDVIMQALVNQDDEIRLSALSLIVESNKTTQCLKLLELELMKSFLWYNINSDSAALKQKNLMLLKKMLTRIRESSYPILKSMKQYKDDGTQMTPSTKVNDTLIAYRQFLNWFECFCFKSLFPGANFSRRASALEMLTMLDETLSLINETLSVDTSQEYFSINWQENYADLLLLCLKDSFESNKNLALNFLMKFPSEVLKLNTALKVNNLLSIGTKLASSVKPPDCITAAYLLKLLVSFPEAEELLVENASKISNDILPDFHVVTENKQFYQRSTFCVIWILLEQLKKELAIAKQDILLAAGSGPMYGTLFSIRHLLKNLNFNAIAENPLWIRIILDLVHLGYELNLAVIHIVNNSSPEGHLPMDFEPAVIQNPTMRSEIPTTSIGGKEETSVLQKPPVTAQMVLLCSWRTVKEVSLFIGDVISQAPILAENSPTDACHLLTESHVLPIGYYFTKLLSETKHRGAFEQAYVGFCQLCKRLWKHPSGILSQLPRIWLKELLNEITKGKQASKLCATRRSAGVPFIVQALITTELDVSQPTCLKEAMEVLLGLLEDRTSEIPESNETIKTESRTHAMNILRALYRHTLLGELVTPYVARGIMAAINGFKGDTWAERNSATLLFGALVSRVFGVKHSREDLHRRNRMTGRVFFERFPALYEFMLTELRDAAANESDDGISESRLQLFPSLFPVLLILSRLYPSSLEGTDSNMQLSAFIPLVQNCLKSRIYKTREIAARAMVPLITANIYVAYLDGAFHNAVRSGTNQNMIHGIILQISFLLQEVPYPRQENEEMISMKINIWVNLTLKLLTDHCEISYMAKEAYIRCLRQLLFISSASVLSSLPEDLWEKVFGILKSNVMEYPASRTSHTILGGQTYISRATQLLLEIALITNHSSKSIEDILTFCMMETHPVECQNVALSFICYIFGEIGNECMEEEDGLPLLTWPRKGVWETKVKSHRSHFTEAKNLALAVVNIILGKSESYVMQRALRALGFIGSASLSISWQIRMMSNQEVSQIVNPFAHLISICNLEPESLGRAALFCLTSLVQEAVKSGKHDYLTQEIGSKYCSLLMEFSSADKNESSRLVVAESLVMSHKFFSQHFPFLTTWDQCSLWMTLLDLLEDHNGEVREAAAKISSHFAFMEDLFKDDNAESHLPLKHVNNENDGILPEEANSWKIPEIPVSFQLMDVMPQRLEEVILQYFGKIFGPRHKYECAITLLVVALRDKLTEEGEYDVNEERVFDKGEANLFAEPLNLTNNCAKHLQNVMIDASLWETRMEIPSSITALIGLDNVKVSSVFDLIKYSMERLMEKLAICDQTCEGRFDPFLTQGFDSMQQEVFKVGLVLFNLKKFSSELRDLHREFYEKLEHTGILSTFSIFCN